MCKQNRSNRIFTNPEYRGTGKQSSHDTLRPRHLLIVVYEHYDISSKQNTEKLLMFTPELPAAALSQLVQNSMI